MDAPDTPDQAGSPSGAALQTDPVRIVPYDSNWPRQFETVAAELRDALGPLLVHVEHIGSTAVPGLAAKPVIDVMGFVPTFQAGFAAVEPLVALGFESMGEFGIPGRHLFTRSRQDIRTHNLHVFAASEGPGGDQPRHELVFRDALRMHPSVAEEYGALKVRLAERFRNHRAAYTEAKTAFITSVVARAAETDPLAAPQVETQG